MSADSDQRSGRPSTSRNADVIDKVRTLIMEDRRLTVLEIVDEVGISRGSANTMLTEDLGIRRVAAKFVPKLLSLESANRDPEFLKTVITGYSFITPDPGFPGQARHSAGLPGSLLS
ncbi:uncharacterized protein LOC110836105 [Zootermopsis nevadensis]|uniref:uncharacterized protein LOC110836105 n=1 Tax=Zootermopsis nevadensis TaxID=136037 RepID=UPI000B8EE78D|nr:uncharacterized protein LOC110836105 [Zootermopsis nevadensis]